MYKFVLRLPVYLRLSENSFFGQTIRKYITERLVQPQNPNIENVTVENSELCVQKI